MAPMLFANAIQHDEGDSHFFLTTEISQRFHLYRGHVTGIEKIVSTPGILRGRCTRYPRHDIQYRTWDPPSAYGLRPLAGKEPREKRPVKSLSRMQPGETFTKHGRYYPLAGRLRVPRKYHSKQGLPALPNGSNHITNDNNQQDPGRVLQPDRDNPQDRNRHGQGPFKGIKTDLEEYDFTLPKARTQSLRFTDSDLVVLGTPVYAGRGSKRTVTLLEHDARQRL